MSNYSNVVLIDAPLRYYRLDESSGTTMHDTGSQAQNGTLNGGVTLAQTGLIANDANTSALFNGSTGYLSFPTTGLPTGAHALSMECWIRMSSLPGADGMCLALGTHNAEQEWYLYIHTTNAVQFALRADNIAVGPVLSANTTYHIVGTYDGTTACLYLNGTLVDSFASALSNLAYGFFYAGTWGALNNFYGGVLDEIALYNSALSVTQINKHYLAGLNLLSINFPVVPVTTKTRDGNVTVIARDGISLTTKTRG